jgi:hypothetical protein
MGEKAGWGGRCKKPVASFRPSLVASSLSSFLCLCPFPVFQSPRFQGTFQKSVLEMPAFFHGEPRPTRLVTLTKESTMCASVVVS